MRYRVYYRNTAWGIEGDCWDDADIDKVYSVCPVDDDTPEDRIIVRRISEEQYYLEMVPEEFRGVLSWMAYDRSHAYGEQETLNTLNSLCTDLKPAIDAFRQKVIADCLSR